MNAPLGLYWHKSCASFHQLTIHLTIAGSKSDLKKKKTWLVESLMHMEQIDIKCRKIVEFFKQHWPKTPLESLLWSPRYFFNFSNIVLWKPQLRNKECRCLLVQEQMTIKLVYFVHWLENNSVFGIHVPVHLIMRFPCTVQYYGVT